MLVGFKLDDTMANQYTTSEEYNLTNVFIKDNFLKMNDAQIAEVLGMAKRSVWARRKRLGLKRKRLSSDLTKNQTAKIMELFTMGNTLVDIALSINKSIAVVSRTLEANYFFKQRSYDTVTMVMDSKINYD